MGLRPAAGVPGGRVDRSTAPGTPTSERQPANCRAGLSANRIDRMKSWQQRERALHTLAKEIGYVSKPHGDRLRVALAFPNTYWVGMSNLGFQTVYRLFNAEDDIVCERVFLPPKQELAELLAAKAPLLTLESQTPVGEFDVIAFSVSFEWDYVNVLTLLRLAGVPRYAAERRPRHPLVVIGGAVTFVNPEPLAPFADVIAAGEGEVLVPGLRRAVPRGDRPRRSAAAAGHRARLLRAVVLRAAVRGRRHADRLHRARRRRRAAAGREGGGEDDRRARSAGDQHLHARHRVRVAVPRRSRPRLRQPVPLLLGRLQLPAGPRVSRPTASCSSRARRARIRAASAWCRSRSAITRTSSGSSRGCTRWAMPSARRRCASTI